jgi:hypothetical protein
MARLKEIDLAVLIIAYSRPDGVKYLLEALNSYGISNIYVAIDGPRNSKDAINQKKINEEIVKYDQKHIKKINVLKRARNIGAAAGVVNAVDWFFSNEKMGLVLEDDLMINQDFCKFAQAALEVYKADNDIWMISGTQHFPNLKEPTKIIWTNYPMVWGWAGWSQKWKIMRTSLLKDKHVGLRNLSDYRYLFWAIGGNRALSGKVDAWDIPLAFEFRIQKKLCLLPPVNLISNIGIDEFATNTKSESEYLEEEIMELNSNYKFSEKPNNKTINEYNSKLEKNIFKIRKRHLFLPYYALFFDNKKFPRSTRIKPLKERLVPD